MVRCGAGAGGTPRRAHCYDEPMRARVVVPNGLTEADVAGWAACAAAAIEPNPCMEPGWLLPALDHLDASPTTRVVLVEHDGAVVACVPIAEFAADDGTSGGHGARGALVTRVAPVAVTLGTPLVSAAGGRDALACAVEEIRREAERRASSLIIMEWVANDGPVARLLDEAAAEAGLRLVEFDHWERGMLRRRDGEEEYWLRGIGKNRRRTIRQHGQRLRDALGGHPTVRIRTDGGATEAFLRLEASGWKGHQPEGLAFARQAATTEFFRTVTARYLDDGRGWFLSLEAGDAPIAMIFCVRSGEGLFAYRTAYDEGLARYGPGVAAFLAAMEYFDRDTDARWFDTCSAPGNGHLLGLFPDRRTMATVMIRVPGGRRSVAADLPATTGAVPQPEGA